MTEALQVVSELTLGTNSLYVYHTLHCVVRTHTYFEPNDDKQLTRESKNMVRKSFDFEYYYKIKSEEMGYNYRDHICKLVSHHP
jgi:hypothetical protein